jgi:hypothetical protein
MSDQRSGAAAIGVTRHQGYDRRPEARAFLKADDGSRTRDLRLGKCASEQRFAGLSGFSARLDELASGHICSPWDMVRDTGFVRASCALRSNSARWCGLAAIVSSHSLAAALAAGGTAAAVTLAALMRYQGSVWKRSGSTPVITDQGGEARHRRRTVLGGGLSRGTTRHRARPLLPEYVGEDNRSVA